MDIADSESKKDYHIYIVIYVCLKIIITKCMLYESTTAGPYQLSDHTWIFSQPNVQRVIIQLFSMFYYRTGRYSTIERTHFMFYYRI